MRSGQAVTVALIFAVAAGGCVSKDTYMSAVRESEDVKADLDREMTQTKALETHVKNLQEQSGKLSQEAQLAASEVQRLKDSGGMERSGIDGRIKDLDAKIKEMAGQNHHLIAQTEDLKKRNKTLEAHVTRAQHELKDLSRSASAMGGPGSSMRSGPKASPPAPAPPPSKSLDKSPPEPGMSGGPPQVAGSAPQPGPPSSMGQEAQSGPQGVKPAEPPQEEDLSLVGKIKRWLSSIWHLFF